MEDAQPVDAELKKRLLNRIALALFILTCLMGSLVIFDQINAPEPPVAPKVAALPPAAPAAPVLQPAPTPAAAAEEPVPERTSAADAPPLPPLPAEKPLTRPATGRTAAFGPTRQGAFSDMRPEPAPGAPRDVVAPAPARPAAMPATSGSGRAVAERPRPSSGESAPQPFSLQLGVFSNLANAQELHDRLEQNGIPATIDARVRIGPFATRAEAEAARAKLKILGIDEAITVSTAGRKAR